jgi:glycosyltransferase involved in cell wall biosynthesis
LLHGTQSASLPDRVVILHDYSQALGGASYLVQVLIAQLRQAGIPVTFFAGDDGANFTRPGVEFIPLYGKPLLERSKIGALTTGFYNHHAYRSVRQWIALNDTPATVYHVHGWSKILTPAIFAALRIVSDRLILHGHDYFNCCPNGGFFNFATEQDCSLVPLSSACLGSQCDKSSYAQKLWRSGREQLRRGLQGGVAKANRLLMIHPQQEESFRRGGWPAGKLFAVRNPVTPPCSERIRAEANRGVIFIGRISVEKGADLAAQAASVAGVPITFVGDGSEVDRVRELNADAAFLGRQDRSGVARALARARLALMPSRWSEPFGLVALEAIGSGVPAIVNERALIAQEIDHAGFGLAIDTADISKFADVIRALHDDDEAVEMMSVSGQRKYLKICNSENSWSQEIIHHYSEVLNT